MDTRDEQAACQQLRPQPVCSFLPSHTGEGVGIPPGLFALRALKRYLLKYLSIQNSITQPQISQFTQNWCSPYSPAMLGALMTRVRKRLEVRASTRLPMRAIKTFAGSMRIFGSVVGYSTKPWLAKRWAMSSR
jgi:hypothetical protein